MSDYSERIADLSPAKRALLDLRLDKKRGLSEPVAIVGMACRFPKADSPEAFWRLLCDGVNAISEVPPDRWDVDAFYDPDPTAPGKMTTRWGGFLDNIDQFDADFFDISPREAMSLDPRQRLLLELTWEALEDAGLAPTSLEDSQTGVFIAALTNDFEQVLFKDLNRVDAFYGMNMGNSILANRISYFFNLRGCSLALDTACSGSLVAVHLACQSLRNAESSLALAGGASVNLLPNSNIFFSKAGAMSPDGRCKTFDAGSNGIVRSDGAGVVVLKLLSQALADEYPIYAVIRGSAVNQDGRSNGLMAPNRQSQEAVLREAYRQAGVSPGKVQYVEAHGTGTNLGDPIEVQALGSVLSADRPKGRICRVGSVKTNLGHLEPAAGIAGLMKVALALKHRLIPPSLHFRQPNPLIPFDSLPLRVQQKLGAWPDEEERLIAGVSGFGFGGTNAHIVLEEAPRTASRQATAPALEAIERPEHLLTLSAKSVSGLQDMALRLSNHLAAHPTEPLANVCYTANAGRSHFAHRLAIVADSETQALEQLRAFIEGARVDRLWQGDAPSRGHPKIAFMFTGQGSQYAGMAKQLYKTQPTLRKHLDACQEMLTPYLERPLLDYVYPENENSSRLDETWLTQPALFSVEYALAQLWLSWGIQPSALLGHSLGEYVAACVAGIFCLEDGLRLAALRGQIMGSLDHDGAMASVKAPENLVEELIQPYAADLAISAYNGPELLVLSGKQSALEAVLLELEQKDITCRRLAVSHAFHSPLMKPALQQFEDVLKTVRFSLPRIPIVSNVSGRYLNENQSGPEYWLQHMLEPVRFAPGIEFLWGEGCRVFLEIGPKPVLCKLARQILPAKSGALFLSSLSGMAEAEPAGGSDWSSLLSGLAQLYTRGAEVDWKAFDGDYHRRKVALPTYPFQRQRYWFEESPQRRSPSIIGGKSLNPSCLHPLLDKAISSIKDRGSIFEKRFDFTRDRVITEHRVKGACIFPGVGYLEMALAAARYYSMQPVAQLKSVVISDPMLIRPGADTVANVSIERAAGDSRRLSFKIVTAPQAKRHAAGEVALDDMAIAPTSVDVKELQSRCSSGKPGAYLYRLLQQLGIEYYPYFRTIEKVQATGREVIARLRLSDPAREDSGYILPPALMDGALQSLGMLLFDNRSEQEAQDIYLPFVFERVSVFGELPDELYSYGVIADEGALRGREEIIKADVKLLSDRGELLVSLDGVCLKRVPAHRSIAITAPIHKGEQSTTYAAEPGRSGAENYLYELRWQPSPLEVVHADSTERRNWLVFRDALGLADQVARKLHANRDRCIPVNKGESFEDRGAEGYRLNPKREEDYRLLAQSLTSKSITPAGIIHMWTCKPFEDQLVSLDAIEEAQYEGAYSLLMLTKALTFQFKIPMHYCVVSSYGQAAGEGEARIVAPEKATLWGLCRVICNEYPQVKLVGVDLETDGWRIDDLAEIVLKEIEGAQSRPAAHPCVAYRTGRRLTPEMARIENPENSQGSLPLRDKGVYLITGGQSGIGLELAKLIAGAVKGRLALVNRTPLDSELQPERAEAIERLRMSGAEVMALQADVSDLRAMEKVIGQIENRWGAIHGVIHSAGVLRDGLILNANVESFKTVFQPKVQGTWVLDKVTQDHRLDFFVLCSSLSSIVAPIGQGNYAAACSFEDAFAHYRFRRGRAKTISINWGLWRDTGMAMTPRAREALTKQGVHALTNEEGIAGFESALRLGKAQVAYFGMESGYQPETLFAPRVSSFEQAGAAAAQSASSDLEARLKGDASSDNGSLIAWVQQRVIKQVAGSLRIDPAEILPEENFSDLGLDSLLVVEITGALEKELLVPLGPTLLFQYSTTAKLTQHLIQTYGEDLSRGRNSIL